MAYTAYTRNIANGCCVDNFFAEIEQAHIARAFIFELSKVETPQIRARMVSHLLNINQELAQQVGEGLRLKEMPKPADAAKPTRQDLKKSPALSILLNGPNGFKGRKGGALVTDGVESNILQALKTTVKKEGSLLKIVAPSIGGVKANDGSWIEAAQKIDGGPSVLYDAVTLLPSEDGVKTLAEDVATRDFIADAFSHHKFIGYMKATVPLFDIYCTLSADSLPGTRDDSPVGEESRFLLSLGRTNL